MSDLRLEMRLKNNLLYKAIFPRWKSVAEFTRDAKAHGYVLHQETVGDLLRFQSSPRNRSGQLTPTAMRLAAFLGQQPETLFPDELYERITSSSASMDLDSQFVLPNSEQVLRRLTTSVDGACETEAAERAAEIERAITTLPRRLQQAIRLRYGIPDGHELTLKELGETLRVSPERARQMVCKAIRLLQHPSRARALEDHFGGHRFPAGYQREAGDA